MDIPIEIFQLILDRSNFLTQIRLRQVDRSFYAKLHIHNFYHIDSKYLNLLTDEILIKHSHITKLYVSSNKKITTISHMTKLTKLFATYCIIDDEQISKLNLTELCATNNSKITNVNHMTNLVILHAGGSCGITDAGISNINLAALNADDNPTITSVNHMTNLLFLSAKGFGCGLTDAGIAELEIFKLYAARNSKITKGCDKSVSTKFCMKCSKYAYDVYQMNRRGNDEAPSLYYRCPSCRHEVISF
jgi:DNA-directed RNA polymerase subunit M/transcription elongation factor TFIIS